MKKVICLLVLLAFACGVQADNKKKTQGGGHAAAPAGHGGGARLPGASRGGGMPHSLGQPHSSSRSGTSHSSSGLHNSTSATGRTQANGRSSNPLMHHGGQARTSGKANPLTQKNHQAGAKNPMQRGGQSKNSNSLAKKDAQGRMNAHNARGYNNRGAVHGLARGSRANYHVRPYRDVFRSYHAVHHDRVWYTSHYDRVVVVGGGYYYWNAGYWYPAWGYDPALSFYAYDGPIYSYDNLPPDQVITNVQTELQDEGYYTGEVDGQLGPQTRDAIGAYQADHDLEVTSAVDEPTVGALGLTGST
ncbi:MAG: peptidoglycan-binding domain-containing protein [Chthoniobacterales bacterium]